MYDLDTMPAEWSHFIRRLPIAQVARPPCDTHKCKGRAVAECGWWCNIGGSAYGCGSRLLCAECRDKFQARHPAVEQSAPWAYGEVPLEA